MTARKTIILMLPLASLGLTTSAPADPPSHSLQAAVTYGERPAVETHLDQADIDAGRVSFDALREHGRLLFDARFNRLDGQGRPGSTGSGDARNLGQPAFIRTSAPDSNACAGCHNQPDMKTQARDSRPSRRFCTKNAETCLPRRF